MGESVVNMVTLSLEDYTKMVIELHDLRGLVAGYRRKIKNRVQEEVRYSSIESIGTTTECWSLLSSSDDNLLSRFSNNYSWRWKDIAEENFNIMTEAQVKNLAVSLIKEAVSDRLKDLKDKEDDEAAE